MPEVASAVGPALSTLCADVNDSPAKIRLTISSALVINSLHVLEKCAACSSKQASAGGYSRILIVVPSTLYIPFSSKFSLVPSIEDDDLLRTGTSNSSNSLKSRMPSSRSCHVALSCVNRRSRSSLASRTHSSA